MACLRGLADVPRHLDAIGVPDPGGTNLIRATLDRIAPEYDVTPIPPATDLSRIAIYIALTANRNPAFPTLSRIARARTEASVHGVSPATAHMPRIVHAIRPRSLHRRSVPAAPLDNTANLLEHCRSNAHRRETVNRTELCARIAARSTSTRADAATARRVGAEIPAPGKPSPSPPAPFRRSRPARPFAAGSTDSMASARFGGTRSAANRSPGRHALSRPTRRDATPPIRRCLREFFGTVAPAGPTLTARLRLPCRRRLNVDCLRGVRLFVTFVAGRRGQEFADSPQVRTPAQTSRRHRLPRAREPLHGEPQDCSDDSPAGQCAQLMHHPLPSRFRPLPVMRWNRIVRFRPDTLPRFHQRPKCSGPECESGVRGPADGVSFSRVSKA